MNDKERYQEDLVDLLKELRDCAMAEESSIPTGSLDEIIESITCLASANSCEATVPATSARKSSTSTHVGDPSSPDDAKRQRPPRRVLPFSALSEIARNALTIPTGKRKPDSRSRELALDCLRLGVLDFLSHGAEDGQVDELDVLSIGAMGSVDEEWSVRVAAARLAGGLLERAGEKKKNVLLSSEQGYWLSALLVDGHPEVEEAARVVLASAFSVPLDHAIPNALPSSTVASSIALGAVEAASASIRFACDILATAAVTHEECKGGGNPRVVDLNAEARTRMAFRVLRAGVILIRSAGSLLCSSSTVVKRIVIEALEVIEAWILRTLTCGPPTSLPWGEESSTTVDGANVPGGRLSFEARDAARALLGQSMCETRAAATEAAADAVEDFRGKCCRLSARGDTGRAAGESEEDDGDEELWRRLYSALLVRLEIFSIPAEQMVPEDGLSATKKIVEVRQSGKGKIEESSGDLHERSVVIDPNAGKRPSEAELNPTESIARALEEVPFAFEHAVPYYLEDDNTLSASAKEAIRSRGGRQRRWLNSAAHLLLRAGRRLCERSRMSLPTAAEASLGEAAGGEAITLKLLVAALPFGQASTDADDPTEAFLKCVRPEPIHQASSPKKPPVEPEASTATHNVEIATPVAWECCVGGQVLPRHRLLAQWASDPLTVELAAALIESALSSLSRGDGRSLTERSAEVIILEIRAAARGRGWRERAGVGIKHAIAATIRRLRFPLMVGPILGHALPLALPLADDHDASHQAVGLSLLLHVAVEATPTELSWHGPLLLEILERGLRGGVTDPAAAMLRLTAAVSLLQRTAKGGTASARKAGFRIVREVLAQAGSTNDGEVRVAMVCGAAALLELPETGGGYGLCEILRPALLCLLTILQSPPISARLDARAAALRALNALCRFCWPRVHAHSSKLLCALLWTFGDCSRRALERKMAGKASFSNNSEITAAADDIVRSHAERLGALVVVLGGDAARSTLEEICAAVGALRSAATAILDLADGARLGGPSAGDEGMVSSSGAGHVQQGGLDALSSAPASTISGS